jgi:hypothetical protein
MTKMNKIFMYVGLLKKKDGSMVEHKNEILKDVGLRRGVDLFSF